MNLDTELREAMRAYTADVVPPAGLLGDVRRGGARRRLRTRLTVAAAPVAVVAAVGGTVAALPDGPTPRTGVGTAAPSGKPTPPDGHWLPWGSPGRPAPVWPVGVRPERAWGGTLPDAAAVARFARSALVALTGEGRPAVGSTYSFRWAVAGRTPSGRRLHAAEWQPPDGPVQVYAIVGSRPDDFAFASRPVDGGSAVPVRVPLPGGEGWLVAAHGAELAWRTGTGAWTPVGRDAALLPAAATEVRAGTEVVEL